MPKGQVPVSESCRFLPLFLAAPTAREYNRPVVEHKGLLNSYCAFRSDAVPYQPLTVFVN